MPDSLNQLIHSCKPRYSWFEMLKLRFKDRDVFLDIPRSLLGNYIVERSIPSVNYPEPEPATTWLCGNFYLNQKLSIELLDNKTIQILDHKRNIYIATAHLVKNKYGGLDLCMWYNAYELFERGLYPHHTFVEKLVIRQHYFHFEIDSMNLYISGYVVGGIEGMVLKKC